MISVDEAQIIVLSAVRPMPIERVALECALGRTLAERIQSPLDHPPWDTSAMDGYALRCADTRGASRETPCHLSVVEKVLAGQVPKRTLAHGEACRIMTGAPMPEGADAVVMVESTRQAGDGVDIFETVEAGDDIRRRGEALRVGEEMLNPGRPIRSGEIGLLASIGKSLVSVFQRPRVAILATGDELTDFDVPRASNRIYNSNGPALVAQVSEAGAIPINLGIARDSPEALKEKLHSALNADLVLVAGGVSVGDADWVKGVLVELGAEMKFWKVAMKPGHPVAFGVIAGRPIFGLPGNPVSVMVTFEQFVRPFLLRAMGRDAIFRPTIHATLTEEIRKRPGRRHFVRVVVSHQGDGCFARPTGDQDSGILKSMAAANGLMVLSETATYIPAGGRVGVQMLSEGVSRSSRTHEA
jgi:molybdopterin molybdotransferase